MRGDPFDELPFSFEKQQSLSATELGSRSRLIKLPPAHIKRVGLLGPSPIMRKLAKCLRVAGWLEAAGDG